MLSQPGTWALFVTLFINTAALFYWGGGVRQILRDHDRRLGAIEDQLREKES